MFSENYISLKEAVYKCVEDKFHKEKKVITYPDIKYYEGIDAISIFNLIGLKFNASSDMIESALNSLLQDGRVLRTYAPIPCFTLANLS